MSLPSRLDDPDYAALAWARYRRLVGWMFAFTLVVTTAALTLFWYRNGFVSIHFYIATGLGIMVAMMLMSALMGWCSCRAAPGMTNRSKTPLPMRLTGERRRSERASA